MKKKHGKEHTSTKNKEGKQRLLIATDNFLPRWDGIARFLSTIIPRLQHHYDITVIAPDFGMTDHEGYRLIKIPLRRGTYGDISFAKLKYWLIKKEVQRADIVFTQTIGPIGAPAIIAARKQKKPLITYIHSLEAELIPMAVAPTPLRALLYPLMRIYTKYLYQKPDLLLTPSEWVSDQLSWRGITTKKKVVRLGVDTKMFTPGRGRKTRQELGIKEEDVVIGQVGRLAREKDVKTLFRAFIRLQKKYDNIKLLIIAKGLPSLEHLLSRREGVIIKGGVSNVVPYLQAMDIFALTSLTETTCLSALEAMSCGKPVVSTPVGFVKYYIKEGKNGYFFPFRDAYQLAKKLERLITNKELRERLGREARKLVEKEFTWERTMKGILEGLQIVIQTQRKKHS